MAVPDQADNGRTPAPGWRPVVDWLVVAPNARGGVDLPSGKIRGLLDALATQACVAAPVAALRPPAGQRAWECLYRDDHVDVYVIAWTAGADTGWHDHDLSSGALRVIEGAVTEERLRLATDRLRRELMAGDGLSFGPDHVHRMTVADGRAVTLHAYSPPLRRLGTYSFDDAGALRRQTITSEESLRAVPVS